MLPRRTPSIVFIISSLLTNACGAATIVVDLNGGADYMDIQSAIDAAEEGDTVLVKPGEYAIEESINFNRFHKPSDPSSPRVKNLVVKSEGGPDVTTILMSEMPAVPCEHASVVVFGAGEGPSSTLDGFLLTGGTGLKAVCNARGQAHGGGVSCWGSSPTLTNCIITGNVADLGGGVFCGDNCSLTMTNCSVIGNSSGSGGILCEAYVGSSSPALTNCTISGNLATSGGGVYCGVNSSPTLTNCTISRNKASTGGGVYAVDSNPVLTNCIIWSNDGGGMTAERSAPTIRYSCIQDPFWEGQGNVGDSPLLVNPGVFDFLRFRTVGRRDLPNFIVEAPDFHLLPGSPCIDAGTSAGAPPIDIDGSLRPCGSGFEMGAYEFGDCRVPAVPFHRGDPNSSGATDISDAVTIFGFLFLGDPAGLSCNESADTNNDATIGISDGIYLLSWLFLGGPEPEAPGPTGGRCGVDPDPPDSHGDLGCVEYPACP